MFHSHQRAPGQVLTCIIFAICHFRELSLSLEDILYNIVFSLASDSGASLDFPVAFFVPNIPRAWT